VPRRARLARAIRSFALEPSTSSHPPTFVANLLSRIEATDAARYPGAHMTLFSATRNTLLAALALGAGLPSPEAHAGDQKYFAAAAICAPFTSSQPDFAKLRFRPEGIINDSDSSKFVICNVPRDSETAWAEPGDVSLIALFRRTTIDTPAVTNNQCTLTVGFNATEVLQSKTFSAQLVTKTYGMISVNADIPTGDSNSYAVMVCRIVPGSLLDLIALSEANPTDS
jgi:hypothetical protein